MPAFAGKRATSKTLTISSVPISSYAIGSGLTVTSDSVYQSGNVGFASMILLVSGTVTVSQQVSQDASNWYTPYTTDGTSLTSSGGIVSSLNANRWIILPAKLSPYVRYIFASTGASTITAKTIWQDEN